MNICVSQQRTQMQIQCIYAIRKVLLCWIQLLDGRKWQTYIATKNKYSLNNNNNNDVNDEFVTMGFREHTIETNS